MTTEHLLSSTPGWLLDVTLHTTVLLALTAAVTACLPRLSAARRHYLQASALLLIPVLMLCTFIAPAWRIPWNAQPPPETAAELQQKAQQELPDPFAPKPPTSAYLKLEAQADTPPSPLWSLLWLTGISAGAITLAFSALTLRRLRASSHPVQSPDLQRIFQEEAATYHLPLPPTSLRISPRCHVPMTWGLTHKTVLLPDQAATWSETRLRLVLRHELAHIARGDILVTLLTTLAALLLWFHPLAWLMLRASHRSREQACDDLALSHSTQTPDDFASELLAAVAALGTTSRPWLPLALAMSVSASATAMRQRLASLIHPARSRHSYSPLQKLTLLLPALAATFTLAGLTACRKPEPAAPQQILIMSRFISIAQDSPVLAEVGLTLDGSNPTLQNLGILNEEQATHLLRKLSQQKGISLMSAPSVTTRSGQKATMEVVREFIYPTEFDAPRQATKDQPVIPTTPTAFEMKPVGVRMDVMPTLLENGSIDLTVTPEVTSFEGFIDYGKPIMQSGQVVSANVINQPIFHTLKTTASFVMQSGQSIVFGGLGSPNSALLPNQSIQANLDNSGRAKLTSHLPQTKDLIFFIIQAKALEAVKAPATTKATAVTPPVEPAVTVVGQVKRQGIYVLKPGMTVQDLVEQAQGLTDRADAAWAQLKRGQASSVLDLAQEGTKPLAAGDVLTVLEKK